MFYNYTDNHLTSGPMVQFPDGTTLHPDFLDTLTLPYEGWYYFATEQEAKDFFGITQND
jgi:hypothetical protein